MGTKLTKAQIDRIKPGTKDEHYWDAETRGFGLRVTPTGKMTFIVQGRVHLTNKEARITIGAYGVYTVEKARDVAREHLRTMRLGSDPREVKRQNAALRVTLAEVGRDYISARGEKLKASSQRVITRHLETTFEKWSTLPVTAIRHEMVRHRYKEMVESGLRGKKGAPGQANQAFAVLSALLNFANRQYMRSNGAPLIPYNPVAALKDQKVRLEPRNRRILDPKIGAVWLALREWRVTAENHLLVSSIDLVRFLLLTGLRFGEASSMTWDQVYLDDRYFHLPDPKNRHQVYMPLSEQAAQVLAGRPKVEGSNYVFPSWGGVGHIKDPRNLMQRLSKAAGSHITPHDLRRTYTNIALRCCRIEKFRVDMLTNHISKDVTSVHYFDTTHLQWLQPEAQMIADYLDQQADIAAGANVVPLHRGSAA